MATKKKSTTKKRKSTTSKKKTKTDQDAVAKAGSVSEPDTPSVATSSAKKKTKSASSSKKKKTTPRTVKKKTTTAKAKAKTKSAAKKTTKSARVKKTAASSSRGADAGEARNDSKVTGNEPASPAVEVEHSDDTIVIRFPSAATPPRRRKHASERAPQSSEHADKPVRPSSDETDAPPKKAARIARDEVDEAPSRSRPEESGESDQPRSKRRRRRKKKDPRPASESDAPPVLDDRAETEESKPRPESAEESHETEEASAKEEPSRRRRRRSRRRRKHGDENDVQERDEAAAEPAGTAQPKKDESSDSPQKEMVINVVPREECRIAIMEKGALQEIYLERASSENHVGNIYKGVVTNVEPSIQAAFVDFGQGKNGFLHISDLHPEHFPEGEKQTENVGRKMPRRNRPPIQRCLRRKQELLVQITKEGIGTKGPTLTTYLSIPGRFLVMMPGMRQLGVSRKIEDEEARRKLRAQLQELELPDEMGFIARTAALDHTKRELQSDLNYLSRLWKAVEKRIKTQKAPTELYTESDLVIRTIRDVYTSDIGRIIIDNAEVAERANEFLSIFSPRSRDTVVHYEGGEPIFHHYGIEDELERLHSRYVPLKSGGSLVIDQTEALVAVDVNSGKFRTEADAETTAYKINLEAADEIPRQLRLRDLGGVVICDFIDMRQESHKREIERRLNRNLKAHKERAKILRFSAFGIIEMTRQRQRASLTRSVYHDCRQCHGTGIVKTPESVVLDVMRLIQLAVTKENIRTIEVTVSPEVAHLLQNRKRAQLHDIETRNERTISIRTESGIGLDQINMRCHDARGRLVPHSK